MKLKQISKMLAVAVALPMTLSSLQTDLMAQTKTAKQEQTQAQKDFGLVKEVKQINATTFEVIGEQGERISLDFYAPNIFRIFYDPAEGIIRNPKATPPAEILVKNPRRAVGALKLCKNGEESFELSSDRIRVVINKSLGLIKVFDKKTNKVVLEQVKPILVEEKKSSIAFAEGEKEYFYGGGVQNGRFSHKGTEIAIENTNSWIDGGVASPSPFYWSTAGYGLLWHTFKQGIYDFGAKEKGLVSLKHNENYFDVFLMFDEKPEELLNDYYQLTGNPVLLPKFGFYQGHLNAYNRDYWTEKENGFMAYEDGKRYNESQKDNGGIKESLNGEKNNYQFSARAAIDRYLNNDMPLGWFLPNDGYGAGYGQEKTLDGNIANLKSFGDYARSKGVEIGLWTQSDLHPKEGIEALLQRDIVKEVRDAGVRVLKTDVAWVGAGYSFGLNGVADVGEIMPYYGNDARPFIISLDGWAGTQRYAGIWSGDQTGGEWEYIRFHIPTFIGSGLSGQPNITSDVDGIFGGKNVPVNVREFQWKTFTPMELNMDGWGRNPKYPHVLGEPATSINRWYLKLKSELMPYAYSIAYEAVSGKPMIRPLFMENSKAVKDGKNYDFLHSKATQYEFLYGDNLLVAPIYRANRMDKEGNDVRQGIYLPNGTWYDYFTGEAYAGPMIYNDFDAPLWKLPVFVKAGAIIPMANPNNNPNEIRKDYRIIDFYLGQDKSEFTLYDDDGKTQAYLNKEFVKTEITSIPDMPKKYNPKKGIDYQFNIAKAVGDYKGFVKEQATEFRINLSEKPKKMKLYVGGKKQKLREVSSLEELAKGENVYFYEAKPNINRFATKGSEFAKKQIFKNPVLHVKVAKCNVLENDIKLLVKGVKFTEVGKQFIKHAGDLSKLEVKVKKAMPRALTLEWNALPNADYYEIFFKDQLYTTIKTNYFTFEDLKPESSYRFTLRAVNADHRFTITNSSETVFEASTTKDPLEFAIKGVTMTSSCANQGGQGLDKFCDRDEKSIWHTKWSEKATPFTLIADLHSINELDKLEYLPREDAANGTILKGQMSYSIDRKNWSKAEPFTWARDNKTKTIVFPAGVKARYVRLEVSEGVGNYGSGRELYIFKKEGTESVLQGDINKDKRLDDNDFMSYMNYTGLRKIDNDFDYVSSGDINKNGLIDAFDISHVATVVDGGVRINPNDKVQGKLIFKLNKKSLKAGEELTIAVFGSKDMKAVNALSFEIPYKKEDLEYVGLEKKNMKNLVNLTYDRLHSNGEKALYPTFVNKGYEYTLDAGKELFVLKFRAKKNIRRFKLQVKDGLLVDRALNSVSF